MKRTPEEKARRAEQDAHNAAAYKDHYYANPNLKNTCRKCGSQKPLRDFMPTYALRNVCRECHRKRVASWRQTQPELTRKMTQRSFRKSAQLMLEGKSGTCSVCNGTYPACALDLHHTDMASKTCNVSRLYQRATDRIRDELAKCERMCANCHRDETQSNLEKGLVPVLLNRRRSKPITEVPDGTSEHGKRCAKCEVVKDVENFTLLKTGYRHSYCRACLREYNARIKRNRIPTSVRFIRERKESSPCADCGRHFRYWIMDYDHVRGDKVCSINKMQRLSIEMVRREIEKCDLVCANCHRVRTYGRKLEALCVESPRPTVGPARKFDVNDVTLERTLDPRCAMELLAGFHYAGYGRPPSALYLAKLGQDVVGVVKFAPPVRKEVATSLGEEYGDVAELDRFCIRPEFQKKNLASRILSMAVKALARDTNYRVAVSFADPAAGHSGTIYRAANWTYVGTSAESYVYDDGSGGTMHKKTVYNAAVARGVTEKEFAASARLTRVKTPGKHKFMYKLRNTS